MPIDTNRATVADLVLEQPTRVRVFERFGIDYCCGGRIPLEQACADRGLDLATVVAELDEASVAGPEDVDWTDVPVGEVVQHIVDVHHRYLRAELPSLRALADKVATRHGGGHPELVEAQTVFEAVADELEQHMTKEELILFPACVALGEGRSPAFPLRSVEGPIAVLAHEHEVVARGLARLRDLTDGFATPAHACTSYRALFGRLETLEADTHRHVHEENNVLFPRALELEAARAA